MKATVYFVYGGVQVTEKQVLDKIKEHWVAEGKKIKDIASLDVYYKSEEGMCYYIINGDVKGGFSIASLAE